MLDYYDRAGAPISMEEWRAKFEDRDYQRVRWTQISPDVEVSTVWLGLDHNYSGDGPPIIFETMIFGGSMSEDIQRYATEEQAITGHELMVALAELNITVDETKSSPDD